MSKKKWLTEGRKHIEGKNIIRAVATKYGACATEEEFFPVDLHDLEPEVYRKMSIRNYRVDLFITQRRGKELYRVIAEIDGGYHNERNKDDELRDRAILQIYDIHTVRFDRDKLLAGKYSEEEIASKLGLI